MDKLTDIFQGLDKKQLAKIESFFLCKEYKPGEVILKPGDKGRVFFVKKGRVELYQISDDGKKFITEILGPCNIFGDTNSGLTSERFVEAVDNCIVYSIDNEKFDLVLDKSPSISRKLFRQVSHRLALAHQKAASLANDDVLRRFIKLLISLGRRRSESPKLHQMITDKYTHEHLAQMIGVSRQTVTTIINELEKKSLVKRVKKKFIFNKSRLEELLP